LFGRHVHRAARIQALAEPEHVLVSFPVYDCAVGWLRGSPIKWSSLGSAPLRGFSSPIGVVEAFNPEWIQPQGVSEALRDNFDSETCMLSLETRADVSHTTSEGAARYQVLAPSAPTHLPAGVRPRLPPGAPMARHPGTTSHEPIRRRKGYELFASGDSAGLDRVWRSVDTRCTRRPRSGGEEAARPMDVGLTIGAEPCHLVQGPLG